MLTLHPDLLRSLYYFSAPLPGFLLFSPLEGLCSLQLARTTALGPLGLACVECQRMWVSALAAAPSQRLAGRESESSASLAGTNSETWLTQPVAYIRTFKLWTFKMWTPLYASYCIALLCFSRHYMVRLKMFSLRTHGCWREGIVRDFGKVMYIWITNKDLLYSTWHSAQCYMPAGMGGGFGGNMDTCVHTGFPGSSAGKKSSCNAGDPSLMPGLGRSPGEGNGYPLQYFCLDPSPWGCKESDWTEWLSLSLPFIIMAESLCCSPETTTLLIGYTPIQNSKSKLTK